VRDRVLLVLRDARKHNPDALGFYQRGGELVRLVPAPPPPPKAVNKPPAGTPSIVALGSAAIRAELTRFMEFIEETGRDEEGNPKMRKVHPWKWLIELLMERCNVWPVPPLLGVVEAPVMLPSGEVLQTAGYHADSGLYFFPRPGAEFRPVEEKPTDAQVQEARALLHEAICDFPLKKPAERAAWIACVLSYFARWMYEGPTPLFFVDGNVAGAGKTKLARLASIICLGRWCLERDQPRDDEEEQRFITSVALAGELMALIDNVERPFGSAKMDTLLTKTTWDANLLYSNENRTYPMYTIWMCSGKNLQIRKGADTLRRIVKMRLESEMANPEERQGFLHPDLLGWAEKERGRLVWAALTILRGWVADGRPDQDLPVYGSFEGWSSVVRNALVWAGDADPYGALARHEQEADPVVEALGELLRGWRELCADWKVEGFTVQEALTKLQAELEERRLSTQKKACYEGLIGALGELCPSRGSGRLPDAQSLGYTLRKHRGRVVGGLQITSVPGERMRRIWTVTGAGT
jgi:hypothetical protein